MLSENMLKAMRKYEKYWWKEEDEREYRNIVKEPFKLLIFTVLSQNTSSENTRRAYRNLSKKFKISPASLSKADTKEIQNAIKVGGLYRIKAKRVKEISEYIMEKYNGSLNWIYGRRKEEIRKELTKIPGIGSKTADVIISSVYGQREAFVVDTHMRRIAIRLGIVGENASYDEIQKALKNLFPWEKIKDEKITSLFWLMAKYICNARKPKCDECVIKKICKYASKR